MACHDLRQFSLGLPVSVEFQFVIEPSTHYRQLAESCDRIILLFDKGSNSQETFESLQRTPFHFVGSPESRAGHGPVGKLPRD